MKQILNLIWPLKDFLYLLQLEEYETKRYLWTAKRFFWRRNLQKRGKLVYTKRIKITLALSAPFVLLLPPFTPYIVGAVNFIISPYFDWIKSRIQKKASEHFRKVSDDTKVIVVAGSYGKTTAKNFIFELIRYNYRTQMIPGNINTPTGIASWILKSFSPNTEVLIVEVDTYHKGEIKRSISITPPDIAILTNIGDQHLERFGSKARLKEALLEVFSNSKPNAIHIQDKKSNLEYALEVADLLQIPDDIVKDTVKKLGKPDRRGDVKNMQRFEVIDHSYNISVSTSEAALVEAKDQAKKGKKKLVVITAGIPELGEENSDGNEKLGSFLEQYSDKVVLLKSVFYKDVIRGFSKNYNSYMLAKNLDEAWKLLPTVDSKNHIVLLFPELNDLYY